MIRGWVNFISIIFLFVINNIQAQNPFILTSEKSTFENIEENLLVYEDTTQKLTIEEIQKDDVQKYFKKGATSELYHQNTYWGKLTLLNQDLTQRKWILRCEGNNSLVEVYIKQKDGSFLLKKTGEFVPASQKDINESKYPMISLDLPPYRNIELYIKISTQYKDPPSFQLSLLNPTEVQTYREWKRFFQGIFQGTFWILILYNLIVYFIIRNKTYLFYSLYMFFISVYALYMQGFGREYLIAEIPEYNAIIWLLSVNIPSILYYAFMRSFLNTPKLIPKIDFWIKFYMLFRISFLPLELIIYYSFGNSPLTNLFTLFATAIDALFGTFILIILYRTRDIAARYFIIGASFLYLAIILMVVLYGHSKLVYAIIYQTGTSLEALLFSLGLGYQMRATEREKHSAQQELIKELKAKENLQYKHTQELETKVIERTNKLTETNQELQQINEELTVTLDALQEKNIIIENQNQSIKDSINYAQRIQESILPYESSLKKSLEDAFIFFRPRDVVSGDFYWFRQKGNESILAAIDCTGHGVPGAFMSLIANDLLDNIVDEKHITSPEKILNHLHKGIRKVLKQEENQNNDGMDVALVNINQKKKVLSFAGAKNSLTYIQNHKLHRIKGNRVSVGGEQKEQNRAFTKHEISLNSPITFYLFSDGFQDQFGGPEGKKYNPIRLRKTLYQSYQKSLQEQKKILSQELDHWKKQEEQVDDILVIGVQLK